MAYGYELPASFRKLSAVERRGVLQQAFELTAEELDATAGGAHMLDLAEIMVESAVGVMSVPVGLAHGFLVDGVLRSVPLAVEEPSVVAAAGYAATIIRRGGGFVTWADEPVMTAQVILTDCGRGAEETIREHERQLRAQIEPLLTGMSQRGGGYRGMDVARLPQTNLVRLHLHVDVRDAMGANILNSVAERAADYLCNTVRCARLMAILTNSASGRIAGARFSIPVGRLARAGYTGTEIADRVVLATMLANEDRNRAVTHNKGVMNGVSSLALATGNDTRGIEAAVHAYAARSGEYQSLTRYTVQDGQLQGSFEAPLPFGVVGGAVGFHPGSRFSLKLLGEPDAPTLSRIAAAVGLAQNFAALYALVTEGIQQGHMRLHSTRLAWAVGARGPEISAVAERIGQSKRCNEESAREALRAIRNG